MVFELAYCEIFNPSIHGVVDDSENCKYIYGSYLLYLEIPCEDFLADDYILDIYDPYPRANHPFIRNWNNVNNPCTLQIVEKISYNDYELCIIKTHLLKIIQRKWKKYYKRKMAYFKNPRNLLYRQLHGKWHHSKI